MTNLINYKIKQSDRFIPHFCFMKLSMWALKTVDSFENLKCNAFTLLLPHRWAYDVMYYQKLT